MCLLERGKAYALDRRNGRTVWSRAIGAAPNSPLLSGDTVYYATDRGEVVALHGQEAVEHVIDMCRALLFPGYLLFGAAAVALQDSLVPLFFPLAAGVGLMGPAVAGGFYELARRREQGLESGWSHFFDVVRRPSFDAFLAVAALLLVLFFAWLSVAAGLYVALMGVAPPQSFAGFVTRLFTTPEGWALIVLGNLAGLAFSAAVLTVSVVAMPMLVDKDVDARTAIHISRMAVMANKGAMLRCGTCYMELFEYQQPKPASAEPKQPYDKGYTHFCVDVTDIEQEFTRLRDLGMRFSQPGPIDVGHVKTIYGRDPEGNLIEIQQTIEGKCDFPLATLTRDPTRK